MNPNPHLQTPGKKKTPEEEYIAAVAALGGSIQTLADRMNDIVDKLDDLANEVAVLSDYTIRKGKKEGIFEIDEYKEMKEGEPNENGKGG